MVTLLSPGSTGCVDELIDPHCVTETGHEGGKAARADDRQLSPSVIHLASAKRSDQVLAN